jgi:hypothetical protein
LKLWVALWLPESSVAEQLTDVVAMGNVLPEGGEQEIVGVGSTRSDAVTEKLTVAPPGPVASAVIFPGTETLGGTVSCTVTVNEPPSVLPESSVAVQFTVVTPTGNVLPDGGEHPTLTLGSTESEADAEKETVAPPGPVAATVMLPGTVMVGAVVSSTVTSNVSDVSSSVLGSVAVHVTVVTPSENVVPEGGEHTTGTGSPLPSVAVGSVHECVAPAGDVASSVAFPGIPTSVGGTATAAGVTSSAASTSSATRALRTIERVDRDALPWVGSATLFVATTEKGWL